MEIASETATENRRPWWEWLDFGMETLAALPSILVLLILLYVAGLWAVDILLRPIS